MDQSEQKAVLDRFLADNPELERLSARLATFNVFWALGIEKAEIRHSNALAWPLDPAESHGLGDVFLRRILSNMLLEGNGSVGISAAQVELMDFADVEVRREWRNIDVLAIDRTNRLLATTTAILADKRRRTLRFDDGLACKSVATPCPSRYTPTRPGELAFRYHWPTSGDEDASTRVHRPATRSGVA